MEKKAPRFGVRHRHQVNEWLMKNIDYLKREGSSMGAAAIKASSDLGFEVTESHIAAARRATLLHWKARPKRAVHTTNGKSNITRQVVRDIIRKLRELDSSMVTPLMEDYLAGRHIDSEKYNQ